MTNKIAKESFMGSDKSWIDWIQFILICMAAPFFIFPSSKYVSIFLVVPVIWAFRWIVKKRILDRTVVDWSIFVLSIQVLATCFIVPDLGFSLPKIAGIFFGIVFFYTVVAVLTSEKLIRYSILVFLGGGLIFSIIGLLGMEWVKRNDFRKLTTALKQIIPKINWNLPGAEAGFNPNAIGGSLILFVPLALAMLILHLKRGNASALLSNNKLSLVLYILFLLLASLVLFFTQSFGSWIGLFLGIWLVFVPWRWKKWSVVLVILLGVFVFSLKQGKIPARMFKWNIGIQTIGEHPLFGIGMNQIRQIPSIGYSTAHVHNHYIHTAAELGIPGLMAYLAILIGMGMMCFQIWRKAEKGWMKMSVMGLGSGQLAHAVFGVTDSIPLGAKTGLFFWISLALIAGMYNFVKKQDLDRNKVEV